MTNLSGCNLWSILKWRLITQDGLLISSCGILWYSVINFQQWLVKQLIIIIKKNLGWGLGRPYTLHSEPPLSIRQDAYGGLSERDTPACHGMEYCVISQNCAFWHLHPPLWVHPLHVVWPWISYPWKYSHYIK